MSTLKNTLLFLFHGEEEIQRHETMCPWKVTQLERGCQVFKSCLLFQEPNYVSTSLLAKCVVIVLFSMRTQLHIYGYLFAIISPNLVSKILKEQGRDNGILSEILIPMQFFLTDFWIVFLF